MKEKLIKFWQRQLDMIIREESLDARKTFFSQAFGGLTLAMMFCGEDFKKADALKFKSVFKQKIKEAEKKAVYQAFSDKK